MKSITISRLKTSPTRVLQDVKRDGTAAVTGKDGEPQAYLIDSQTYERMRARMILLEGIARGEKDLREGRVFSQAEARKKMARWLKPARP